MIACDFNSRIYFFNNHLCKAFIVFALLTFATNNLIATNLIDSLKIHLNQVEGEKKLEILQMICREYLFQSYDSCIAFGEETIKLAQELNDKENEALANKNIGYVYYMSGDFDKCLDYYNRGQKLFEEVDEPLNLAIITNMIGDVYRKITDYPKAITNFIEAKEICDSLTNTDSIQTSIKRLYSMLYTNLGLLYFIRKNALTKKQLTESEAARIEGELEAQKRELTLGALSVSRNIEFINSLIDELKDLTDCVTEDGLQSLNNIFISLTKQQSDNSWKEFERRVSDIHNAFYSKLLTKYTDLTQSEVKLSAFLKLGMNTKEICAITLQSVRAVKASQLRLR